MSLSGVADAWLQYLDVVVEVTLILQARPYHQLQRRFLVRVYTTVRTLSRRTSSTIPIRFISSQANKQQPAERGRKGKAQCSAAQLSASNCLLCCEALPGLGWGSRVHPHPSNHDPSLARFVATERAAPPGLSPPIIPDPNPKSPNKAQVMELDPQSQPPSVPVARSP